MYEKTSQAAYADKWGRSRRKALSDRMSLSLPALKYGASGSSRGSRPRRFRRKNQIKPVSRLATHDHRRRRHRTRPTSRRPAHRRQASPSHTHERSSMPAHTFTVERTPLPRQCQNPHRKSTIRNTQSLSQPPDTPARQPRKGEGAFLPPCGRRTGTGMSPLRCRSSSTGWKVFP